MAKAITYEDLQKANALIQTTPVKGKDYAEVPQRVKAFRSLYPQGTISTEIVKIENGMCVIHAVAAVDGVILGEGTAYEMEGSSFINKTSYIENCETSAVGRALGFAGFGIDAGIASYEEVMNAKEQQKSLDDKIAEIKRLIQETNTDTRKFLYSMGVKFKRELGSVDELNGKAEIEFALDKMREKQKALKESEGK
ncbi:MAG: hypothetical protein U0L88_09525 [Acutalibacteraceae bacterium]|nr:hypothetical protein [Acutalibacteraceae bacterium]